MGRIEPVSWKDEGDPARKTMVRTRAATSAQVFLHLPSMVKSVDYSSYLEMNPSWETSTRLCCLQVRLFNVDIRTAAGTRLTPLWILTELRDVKGSVDEFESRRTKAVKKKKRKGPTFEGHEHGRPCQSRRFCAPLLRTRAGLARSESLKLFCPHKVMTCRSTLRSSFLNDATTF